MRNKINIGISIDTELLEELDKIAGKKDRSRSYLINKILKDFIEKNKE